MADTVLDLSAKSHSDIIRYSPPRRISDYVSLSPSTSPAIVNHSDGNESDSLSRPVRRTPVPKNCNAVRPMRTSPSATTGHHSNPDSGSEDKFDSSGSGGSPKPGMSGSRPFKMYPSDAMAMYSSSHLMNPSAMGPSLNGALGLSSLYDSAAFPTFPITPLTSHLLQRKRRAESRISSSSSSTAEKREEANNSDDGKRTKPMAEDKKDNSYWERRRKNNEAAKRSRDTRRMKEEEIAMRAAFLEQENLKLRAQVSILKNETAKLHYMLYNRL